MQPGSSPAMATMMLMTMDDASATLPAVAGQPWVGVGNELDEL